MKIEKKKIYPALNGIKPLGDKAKAWLKNLGIDEVTAAALGVKAMPHGQNESIVFEYTENGKVINASELFGDRTMTVQPGCDLTMWNLHNCDAAQPVIVTTSEIDAMAIWQTGHRNVASLPPVITNWEWVESAKSKFRRIIIATDHSAIGTEQKTELVRRWGPENCTVVEFDDDTSCPSAVTSKYGNIALDTMVAAAKPVKVEGVFSANDLADALGKIRSEGGLKKGLTTGLASIDGLISWEPGQLVTFTGWPGSGKSEMIDDILLRLNIHHGWKLAFFSPENAPLSTHATKHLEKLTGQKIDKLSQPDYLEALAYLDENVSYIYPENHTLDNILLCAQTLVRTRGIKVLVIDPYNALVWTGESAKKSGTDRACEACNRLIKFAQQENVLVILQVHPAKDPVNGNSQIPGPSQMADSAHFYNKAYFCCAVGRDQEKAGDPTTFKVSKVKHRNLGRNGECKLLFDPENGRFNVLSEKYATDLDKSNWIKTAKKKRYEEASKTTLFSGGDPITTPEAADDLPF